MQWFKVFMQSTYCTKQTNVCWLYKCGWYSYNVLMLTISPYVISIACNEFSQDAHCWWKMVLICLSFYIIHLIFLLKTHLAQLAEPILGHTTINHTPVLSHWTSLDRGRGHSYCCDFDKLLLKTPFRRLSSPNFPLQRRD